MQKRRILVVLLLLAAPACTPEPQEVAESWRSGRDGLCLVGKPGALRAGVIAYGPSDANCSLAGSATRSGERLTITPRGDPGCRIEVSLEGDKAHLGPLTQACAYYCGPGADFSGRTLGRSTEPVGRTTDFAGDPLC